MKRLNLLPPPREGDFRDHAGGCTEAGDGARGQGPRTESRLTSAADQPGRLGKMFDLSGPRPSLCKVGVGLYQTWQRRGLGSGLSLHVCFIYSEHCFLSFFKARIFMPSVETASPSLSQSLPASPCLSQSLAIHRGSS